jgi:hypothetical protein
MTVLCYLDRGHRKQSRLLERSIGDILRDRQSSDRKTDLFRFYDQIYG